MPVLNDRKIIFVHIPKCAGTSIERAAGWADAYPDIGRSPTRTVADYSTLFGGGLQHLTIREIRDFYLDEPLGAYHSFSVIRNPFHRLASHFLWLRYRFRDVPGDLERLRAEFDAFTAELYEENRHRPEFADPCAGYAHDPFSRQALQDGRHVLPQSAYVCIDGAVAVDDIIPMEELDRRWAGLAERMSCPGTLERSMASRFGGGCDDLYTEAAEGRVRELYSADFALHAQAGKPDAGPVAAGGAKAPLASPDQAIPRTVYMYWDQGWDKAPALVRQCCASFVRSNPDFTVERLDRGDLAGSGLIPDEFLRHDDFPLAALSDVVRIHLLEKHGGIWADATVWCQVPLSSCVRLFGRAGFFAYSDPVPGRPLASWFLASSKGHYVTRKWKEAVVDYWLGRGMIQRTRPHWGNWSASPSYFWFHGLFRGLLDEDGEFARLWSECLKRSADEPHLLQKTGLNSRISRPVADHVLQRRSAVYKLSCRGVDDASLEDPSRVVGFLFAQSGGKVPPMDEGALRAGECFERATTSFGAGETGAALEEIEQGLALQGDVPEYHLLRARILEAEGRYPEAVEALQAAIALEPQRPDPHMRLCHAFDRCGDLDSAIRKAGDAVALDHGNPCFHLCLGNLLFRRGDMDVARAALEQAVALGPDMPGPHIQLSHLYFRRGDLDAAIREAGAAIALDGANCRFHDHLGNLLHQKGDEGAARAAWERAAALRAGMPES